MNPDRLSSELHRIGGSVATPSLADGALALGRRRRARRRQLRSAGAVVAAVAAFVSYGAVSPSAPPASAALSCYSDRAVVTRSHAVVSRAGVRVDVVNATAHPVRILAGDDGAIVPPGRSEVDLQVRPGVLEVACDTGATLIAATPITAVDRKRYYVDDTLDCATPDVTAYRGVGDVEAGDPLALTARHLADATGVTIERAGYRSEASRRLVRLRRDTHILGLAVWHRMPDDTWTLDQISVCAPLAIR